ncbi:MAG: dockerin type I repeat-containing protein [Oscillospiraceae bacterium]|nr:dockerin type I repeat-containing protein [Oscillospiraceae bacterium]
MKKRILAIFVAVVMIFAIIPSTTATDITTTLSQTPIITVQPESAVYYRNATPSSLTVEAHVTDSGTLTYQWYSNIVNSNTGGKAIEDATSSSLMPSTTGTHDSYYYAVVTNMSEDNAPASITSDVVAIYFELDLGEFSYTLGPWSHVQDYRREYVWSVQTPHPSAPKRNLTRGIFRNAVELRIEFKEAPAADIKFNFGGSIVVTFNPEQGTSFVFDFTSVDWTKIASDDGSVMLEHHSDYDLRDIIESAILIYRGNAQTCNMCQYNLTWNTPCYGCLKKDCMSVSHITYCGGYSYHHMLPNPPSRPPTGIGNPSAPDETPPPPTPAPLPKLETFTTADALNILRYVAGIETLTPEQRVRYDTNNDGVINTADALNILRLVAGLIDKI